MLCLEDRDFILRYKTKNKNKVPKIHLCDRKNNNVHQMR